MSCKEGQGAVRENSLVFMILSLWCVELLSRVLCFGESLLSRGSQAREREGGYKQHYNILPLVFRLSLDLLRGANVAIRVSVQP